MKKFIKLFNDNVTGGLFFLIPIFVPIFSVNKIGVKITGTVKSLLGLFNINKIMDEWVGAIITIYIVLLISFISDVLFRAAVMSAIKNKLDAFLDNKILRYGFYMLALQQKIKKDDAFKTYCAVNDGWG